MPFQSAHCRPRAPPQFPETRRRQLQRQPQKLRLLQPPHPKPLSSTIHSPHAPAPLPPQAAPPPPSAGPLPPPESRPSATHRGLWVAIGSLVGVSVLLAAG